MRPESNLSCGLVALTGPEGSGKTAYQQALCKPAPGTSAGTCTPQRRAVWLDLGLPGLDQQTPSDFWRAHQSHWTDWHKPLQSDLVQALQLSEHVHKQLFMLSRGSRRKVGLVAILASGASISCLDQPYAALDLASIEVIRAFLSDMAEHTSRTWLVADYEADSGLPWRQHIQLPDRTA